MVQSFYQQFIRCILTILCIWLGVVSSYADNTDSTWIHSYNSFIRKDHKGNMDTLTTYNWKAFNLARKHHNDSLQVRAIGNMLNMLEIDSIKRYLSVLDTFPKTPHSVYNQTQMRLSYYRLLINQMPSEAIHTFVETMIQKADSVYADSLYSPSNMEAKTIYLLNNRLYLSALLSAIYLDSTTSPFYNYLTRLNKVVEQLPNNFIASKINSYITSSEMYVQMKDYKNTIKSSEQVIQSIISLPNMPESFLKMELHYACICYYMCYQQLYCYDNISPKMLERNWAFIHSDYGDTCRKYITRYEDTEITPTLYYNMAKKKYEQVIATTENNIQRYNQKIDSQYVYISLQNEAIKRCKHPQKYLSQLFRNYKIKQQYQEKKQQEKETDFAILFKINKIKHNIAIKQLQQENKIAFWSILLFSAVVVILLLSIWGIIIVAISNKRKRTLIIQLKSTTQKAIAEKQQAERAKMLQTTSLDNMNHEIRSPLNTIVGFSELLLEDPTLDKESKEQFSEQITVSSNMLLQLINDVLDTAQLESGHYILHQEEINVSTLCDQAIQSMTHRKQANVQMQVKCNLSKDTMIHADKTRLLQILFNFLSNACKHTEKGQITLHCAWTDPERTHVIFSVTDTGPGVPENKRQQLFERFAKLNHKAQGTGLGLNIAATLAHVMNGEIGYDSSYTDGARFYLILPTNNSSR